MPIDVSAFLVFHFYFVHCLTKVLTAELYPSAMANNISDGRRS